MSERIELRIGEERAVHLPPGQWDLRVDGMTSAVDVRKLWPADPYPQDDEDEEAERPSPDVVFMVRALAPGQATLHISGAGGQSRDVEVIIRM